MMNPPEDNLYHSFSYCRFWELFNFADGFISLALTLPYFMSEKPKWNSLFLAVSMMLETNIPGTYHEAKPPCTITHQPHNRYHLNLFSLLWVYVGKQMSGKLL